MNNETVKNEQTVKNDNQVTDTVNEKKAETVNSIEQKEEVDTKKRVTSQPKKKNVLAIILLVVIVMLIGYIFIMVQSNKTKLLQMQEACSPVSTIRGDKELDLNSTIVQDLYNKVKTNIREDLASVAFDDEMKRYLAARQIAYDNIYDSNCNLFDKVTMEPYICVENSTFSPTAFKEETLEVEIKKLFGENTNIPKGNVQLGKTCLGGYQYIEKRGEYVQGYCEEDSTTQYRVTKTLVKAVSNRTTIKLTEEVKYHGAEQLNLPEYLKSGKYVYTFKLDSNYNYVYVSKNLEE